MKKELIKKILKENHQPPSLLLEIVGLQKVSSLYNRLLRKYLKDTYGCSSSLSRKIVIDLIKLDIEDKDYQAKKFLESFRRNGFKNTHVIHRNKCRK